MIRKLSRLALLAGAVSFVAIPADARFIRGTGTGASSTTTTTTPAVTSGTFYGDSSYASAAPAFDWRWLVAYSLNYATQSANAAAAGTGSLAYAMGYVCGEGGTGNSPVTTCSAVYANATTGLPDLINAVVVASGTAANIGTKQALTKGSGTTANNPCFGSDTTSVNSSDGGCRWFGFDEISQLAGTVPSAPTSNVTTRLLFFQSCANYAGLPNTNTNPCFVAPSGQQQVVSITYPNSGAQPYTFFGVTGTNANSTNYFQSTSAANPYSRGSTTANTMNFNGGASVNVPANIGSFHAYNALFNGTSSLIQMDQATQTGTVSLGTNAITGTYTIFGSSVEAAFGFSLHSGSLTAAQQAAANKLMSTTFGGTGSATSF